jgi:hypothetical protein
VLKLNWVARLAVLAMPAFLYFAAPASAEAPPLAVQCRGQWAASVRPLVNNITGNAFGLFLLVAIPAVLVAIMGLMFFHWSRHRSVLFSFAGIVVFAMLAVQVWPGFANSIMPKGC